jgi:membrane protein YdbS with pleckstrin-like domain
MQCPRCSAEVDPQAKFCPECGAATTAEPQAAAPLNPAGRAGAESVGEERELWQGSYSGKSMIGVWVLLAVVSVVALAAALLVQLPVLPLGLPLVVLAVIVLGVIWLYALAVLVYRKMSVHYRVTTQRLIHRRGILKVATDRIELIDVDDISFTQGLVERMLGVGTIAVRSSDRTHPELKLHGIDGVQKVADLIDDARRKERRRHGLHIETI